MENTIENFIVQIVGNNTLLENSYIDISSKNIGIKSFNIKENKIEYKKILKIIRKKDCFTYEVKTLNNSIKVTKDHKFFIKLEKEPFFTTVDVLLKIKGDAFLFTNKNNWEKIISIKKLDHKKEIYDLEVEGNHNLFTNNLLSHNSMGESTTTTGGKAIKYYADVRWKVWKMNDKINELNKTTVDVIKNKLAAPFGQAKINILWGEGFDKLGELIDYAVEFNFIKKGGAWFTFGEDKFQGMERIKDYLEENPEILLDLEKRVLDKLNDDYEPTEEILEQPEIKKSLPVQTLDEAFGEPEKLEE